jgi:TRAP-type mannitol/chloroaromatic compound transport system substrate-binding protein
MAREQKRLTRRAFIAAAGATTLAAACTQAAREQPSQQPQAQAPAAQQEAPRTARTFTWKMQSTWTAGDWHQQNPKNFVDMVQEMSGGRLRIELLPVGAVVPAFEVLDAVHKGLLDAGNAWPGYWYGKHPAATLFGSAPGGPFGMNSEDFLGWMYLGGGLDLYNELLQKELGLNVVAFPSFGETPEPLGWFPRPIRNVADFKGLKFRAAGMSAEVFSEFGMSVVTLPGGEIIPALERKVIDAAEFSDPTSDMSLGFQDVLKYYHLPGIHQPTGIMEILINKQKWDELPTDLKAIVRYAAMATTLLYTVQMLDRNSQDLKTLVERHGVTVVESPRDVLEEVLKAWDRVAEKYARQNAFFAKVLESQRRWAERIVPYRRIAHPPYELAADYYWKGRDPYRVVRQS